MKRLLSVGLIIFASASMAQPAAVPATGNVAGQASTQTQAGVPNPTQRPSGAMPNTRADVKAGARAESRMPDTSKVPRAEASTMVDGQPNAAKSVNERSRASVRSEARTPTKQNKTGMAVGTSSQPTNPGDGSGTPK